MTNATTQRKVNRALTRLAIFCLFALAAALAPGREARAQWATSGTNINNTNPGGVGVGTADPTQGGTVGSKFTVASTDDNSTAIATSNGTTPRFALNNHANGSWTMYDYTGNVWNVGITQQSGNVGIGTTSPGILNGFNYAAYIPFHIQGPGQRSLVIDSGAPGSGFVINDSSQPVDNRIWSMSQGAGGGKLTFSTYTDAGAASSRVVFDRSGNVGIGTTTPSTAKLVVSGTAGAEGLDLASTDQYANLRVIRNSLNAGDKDLYLQWQAGQGSKIHFYSDNAESMTLNSGKVGIGTATPSSALHVVGDITVSGNINAKYQDVAEWVPSRQKLNAGTVVILDEQSTNQVLASNGSYDTRVAGVVSAQPGIALGERGEGKVLVATTGRVKVKVDATQGAIKVGDLLVTSDREGYAMKSEPLMVGKRAFHSPGTIVGKALEPLAAGTTGEILVLLSLQ